MHHRARIAAGTLIALLVAACGVPVALRTAPAAVDACDDALQAGVLVASARSGLAVQRIVGQGEIVEVIWPFGYSATRDTSGLISLHDASGKEIAREGDTITLGGGLDGDGVWNACSGTVENAPGI